MKLQPVGIIVLAAMWCSSGIARATTINFSTGTTPWSVSAGGAIDVAPHNVNGNSGFSITSNGFSTGTPVPGLNIATFDGWWAAYFPFYLPANAVNVQLIYTGLNSDDRAVFELNGIPIGTASYSAGLGSMTFTDGGPNVAYKFAGDFTSGSVSNGFILGAPNLLQGIINNTGSSLNGVPQNISPTDGTDFGVLGTITYTLSPEPASFPLLVAGLIPFIARRRRVA